jgi:ABC-2 type transport system ATP-binding protein
MGIIEARDLCMQFGSVQALNHVTFEVREGEILGLLGPNGAGKTTAMRILTTYLIPTAGTATVAGFDVLKQPLEVRRRIGYLPETAPLYPDMEVREYLTFVGRGRGLASSDLKRQLDYVLQACELASVYRRPIVELSKGFKQRVGLAQALIHDPELLILDEPTSGLDPLQIRGIRDLLRQLIGKKKTIIFSSHILQEVTEMTDRVVMIAEGRIVAEGTIRDICDRIPQGRRTVLVVDGGTEEMEQELRQAEAVVQRDNGVLRAEFPAGSGPKIVDLLRQRTWPVREIREEAPSLEQAFVYLIQEARRRP